MQDLKAMRDKSQREEAQREQADRAPSKGAFTVSAQSIVERCSRPRPVPPPVPEEVLTLRKAAGLGEFASHERWDQIADKCLCNLAAQLGKRYSPALARLDKFAVYDQARQASAIACFRGFVGDLEQVLIEGRGLVLFGTAGTGKDHLLASALYRVAGAGIPTGWTSGAKLFGQIRDSMDDSTRESAIINPLLAPVVLGISDPVSPRGDLSDWDARILAGLIDERYRAMRPTWVTLNAINEADANNKLTGTIWDRLRDGATIIPCFWPSYRGLRERPARATG